MVKWKNSASFMLALHMKGEICRVLTPVHSREADHVIRSCDVKANQRRRIGAESMSPKLLSSDTNFCVSAGILDALVAFKVSLDEELKASLPPLLWCVSTQPTDRHMAALAPVASR